MRLNALNEAVQSFLMQDYPNRELIVVIDSPGQTIKYDHPMVKVINSPERFATLGDKLNAAIRQASGEFICRWDDDDISLPWRISDQMAYMADHEYLTAGSIWFMHGNTLEWQIQSGYGHSQGMVSRKALDAAGGYPATSGDEDAKIHAKLLGTVSTVQAMESPERTAYIYRWNDGLGHISAHGASMAEVYRMNGELGEPGEYELCPQWQRDYVGLTRGASVQAKPITVPAASGMKLCVIGFPSRYGGADTELDHQITVWRAMGVDVHLIPTGEPDAGQLALGVAERGCTIHRARDWSKCQGMHVISYCNGEFLANLPEIRRYARSTTFVNCMTWLFDKEKSAHAAGLIDWFLYQTDHARAKVQSQLEQIHPKFQWARVRPYFDAAAFPFVSDRPDGEFVFCRVSRDDPAKFAADTMRIFDMIQSPVPKRGVILGITPKVYGKTGPAPAFVECLPPGGRPAVDVYREAHILLQSCDTYENLPRVAMEAMASGCVPVCDDRGGFQEIIEHQVSGMLCGSTFDFVAAGSNLAQDHERRRQMAQNARQRVIDLYGLQTAMREWSEFFTKLEAMPVPEKPVELQKPNWLIRGWNFTTAMAKWTAAGMKMRSQAEIDARLAICQACPYLDRQSTCTVCGCACVETNQVLNKLAIATEKCPMGKWE
jgi:glycosyltransferase involved in cell wall biosynthesis